MTKLLDHVLQFYIASAERGSFNGVRADHALLACGLDLASVAEITALVASRGIDCMFTSVDLNPHIKRLPAQSPQEQIARLHAELLSLVCLYPTVELLAREVSADIYRDAPFSRALLLGGAQLDYVGFELAVLGRYRSDPRFNVTFEDYVGTMSVTGTAYQDEDFPERDKISIQSFGLGFDDDGLPHVVAFLRYLANLTPEHQQYWNSFRASREVLICEPYYRGSIIGDFWSNRSVRPAIEEEMRLINEMAGAAFGKPFFRHLLSPALPFDLSSFLVPSTDNYEKFVHSWDKMLSDNLDKKFFAGSIADERDEERADGKIVVIKKGTLMLLKEWLEHYTPGGSAQELVDAVVVPLQNVRRERQAPAHRFSENAFSKDFHEQRRKVLWSIYESLTTLREVMSRQRGAENVHAPDWLREGLDVI